MAISNSDFARSSSGSPIGKVDVDPPTTTAVNDSDVTFTDITTGNASTTKHGFLKKLSNVATEFLNGAGNFVTLAQSSVVDLVTDLAAKITGSTGSTDNAILRADGTGGKTSQSSGITIDDSNNIVLPTTTGGATTGIVYKGASTFIHNYRGNYSGIIGANLNIGLGAGNLTSNATSQVFQASQNLAIGDGALTAITTGYGNCAIGYLSGNAITTGANNFAMGYTSLQKVVGGADNAVVGPQAGRYTTGNANTIFGTQAGKGVSGTSTYGTCVGMGFQALTALTTGSGNIAIGYRANDIGTTGAKNIIIGYDADPSSATASNELNIGGVIKGVGINTPTTVSIGIGGTPNANAVLDCQSTTKPFMPPRMTTTQRDAVASPTAGMVIYNSTTNKLNVYTTAWEAVTSA